MLSKFVEIQDFSIVVVADNQNPSILNPDFLKYNHIVPAEWELAMPPICTPPVSQVIFKNGVNILAQSDRVTFWEAFEPDDFLVKVPEVSSKYVEALPYIGYQAVGINLTGHIVADKEDDAEYFVLNRLIASGAWKSFQGSSPDVAVQFTYPMDDRALSITIQGGFLEEAPDNKPVPIVIFTANFHRNISGSTYEEKVSQLKEAIQSWETDFNTFKSLVEGTFIFSDEGKEL